MYKFKRFSQILPCIGCLFVGLLLSSSLFGMNNDQIAQLKNEIAEKREIFEELLNPDDFYDLNQDSKSESESDSDSDSDSDDFIDTKEINKKLSYLEYLNQQLNRKQLPCFAKQLFNKYKIDISSLFYQNIGKSIEKDYLKDFFESQNKQVPKIYISAVKNCSKNLIIVQLPVPGQQGLQCSSNAFRYSTLFAKDDVFDFLWKPFIWSKEKNKNIIADHVSQVGEGGCTDILNNGFSTEVKTSGLYRSCIDIYNLSFLNMSTQKQIKNNIEHRITKGYKEDPRIRFSVSGQPEIFSGGITSSEGSGIGHDIAWRLEYLGNIQGIGNTYAIIFCDSNHKENMIDKYKNKFIAFLNTMVMTPEEIINYKIK